MQIVTGKQYRRIRTSGARQAERRENRLTYERCRRHRDARWYHADEVVVSIAERYGDEVIFTPTGGNVDSAVVTDHLQGRMHGVRRDASHRPMPGERDNEIAIARRPRPRRWRAAEAPPRVRRRGNRDGSGLAPVPTVAVPPVPKQGRATQALSRPLSSLTNVSGSPGLRQRVSDERRVLAGMRR